MCTRNLCEQYIGKWVRFQTPWGIHTGIIERVTDNEVIIVSPQELVPVQVASQRVTQAELKKIDAVLAWGGGVAPYPGTGGYGPRPGFGGWGYGGWFNPFARWAVAFLSIYALWGLLLWW